MALLSFSHGESTDSGEGEASSPEKDRVSKIKESLDATLRECPNRIWPDLFWRNSEFRIRDGKQTHIYSVVNGQLETRNASKEDQNFDQFSYMPYENKSGHAGLHIHLQKADEESRKSKRSIGDSATQLAIHEGMHYFTQFSSRRPWRLENPKDPFLSFPRDWKVPYLQRMLTKNLRIYLETGEESFLSKAAYWYQQIPNKPRFFRERKSADILEGTAVYAEIVGTLIGEHGCSFLEDELQAEIAKNFDKYLPMTDLNFSTPLQVAYDNIPYALFALRKRKTKNFEKKIQGGRHMYEILFDGVKPLRDGAERSTIAKARQATQVFNSSFKKRVEEQKKILDNPNLVRVSIPDSTLGPTAVGNKIRLESSMVNMGFFSEFEILDGSVTVGRTQNTMWFQLPDDPCPTPGLKSHFLIPRDQVKGLAIEGSKTLRLSKKAKQMIHENGKAWLCFDLKPN